MMPFVMAMAWRETRAGWRHFVYFFTCIAVGVGALVGVALFGANVERAVTREARGLLGGDLEIRLTRPMSPAGLEVLASLAPRGITMTHVSELVGMAAHAKGISGHEGTTQLVELKAVEALYPLYGRLRIVPDRPLMELLHPRDPRCPSGPCYGAVVQEALLIKMGLTIGDRLTIGQATFLITAVVKTEPDRMANAFTLGPRVLVEQEGLGATALVTTGSRIRERYLLKVPAATPAEPLLYELRGRLAAESARVSAYRDAQPQLKQFLDQLTRYLGLIGLTALFVGGLGVATSIHAFVRDKMATIATLKTLGADSRTILATYTVQASLLGLAGSLAGLLLGIGLNHAVPWGITTWIDAELMEQVGFTTDLTWASGLALGKGLALGLLTTWLFALWPLLAVREIKPSAILRRRVLAEDGPRGGSLRMRWPQPGTVGVAAAIAAGLGVLSVWQAGSWRLGVGFLAAFALALALLGGTAWLVLRGMAGLRSFRPLVVRQAVGNLIRPGSQAVSMMMAVGIGVMVIVTVALVERELLYQVGESRPSDSPTFFFIDIQPDQAEGVLAVLRARPTSSPPALTPLVRSRLAALNGQPVKVEALSPEEDQARRTDDTKEERRKAWYLSREYVLTFLDTLPKDNVIVQGAWWSPGQVFDRPLVSLEEEAARMLGLRIGDTVTLDIQGVPLEATVSSIRKVEWGNFSTNFYMILSPGSLDGAPITYVATTRVPPDDEVPLQQAVVSQFPNVTAINVGDVLDNFARMLDRLSLAIRSVAVFCVAAGGLVMGAALAATRYRRLYESVILKALGATRGLILRAFALEYVLVGLVGGGVGAGLASALSWGLLRYLFDLPWGFHPQVLAAGVGLTVVLTCAVGFFSTYRLLAQAPLAILRQE